MPDQLAREFLAVVREARDRNGLLLLVLPAPPPVHVKGHGRLALHDAVALCLPRVLELAEGPFPPIDELRSIIDSTVAYTTWPRIEEEVKGALKEFPRTIHQSSAALAALARQSSMQSNGMVTRQALR